MSPPSRSGGDGGGVLCPNDLRLPGGTTPHDFLRTDAAGEKVEADRFEPLRPDAVVEVQRAALAGAPGWSGATETPSQTSSPTGGVSAVETTLDVIIELDDG